MIRKRVRLLQICKSKFCKFKFCQSLPYKVQKSIEAWKKIHLAGHPGAGPATMSSHKSNPVISSPSASSPVTKTAVVTTQALALSTFWRPSRFHCKNLSDTFPKPSKRTSAIGTPFCKKSSSHHSGFRNEGRKSLRSCRALSSWHGEVQAQNDACSIWSWLIMWEGPLSDSTFLNSTAKRSLVIWCPSCTVLKSWWSKVREGKQMTSNWTSNRTSLKVFTLLQKLLEALPISDVQWQSHSSGVGAQNCT